ncbi:cysteine desulfurase family protein [Intestinimonas butyriciproducens]|uniref:cysteine desulfurase family protein n=1 Tax=Intestinimonas butyriciproducens TaxID=1297617 RepID=UPI00189A0586|nr:cysteine desulfurase family protein [Intestinimonas butyriciproducens]MDB7829190.1 cysteine desulfurase family protein [Intestinimonas butyriciproducens]
MVYLDNAATTRVSPEVVSGMIPYFEEVYGNAGSIHCMGRSARKAIDIAREQVSRPIGAKPENIIFTSCGSEANNLALFGVAEQLSKTGNTHIIISNIEHDSVLGCVHDLQYKYGFDVSIARADKNGIVSASEIKSLMREYTGLVSVMAVNNELGTMNPIREIGELCRSREVMFHTDCVQAYCNIPIDVEKDCIDFLSVSGHKFHAPKGVGFLYARNKEFINPILVGGGQEYGLRAGTENTPYIVGLGKAAELASDKVRNRNTYSELIRAFVSEIGNRIDGVHINGTPYSGSKIVNIRFDGVDSETLLLFLDSQGVCVSAGSACAAHSAKPSHVLKAIGLTDMEAKSSIRISISDETTKDELNFAAKEICESVNILRGK